MKVCFLISLSVSSAINDYCRDQDKRCQGWAEMGECLGNPDYMLVACKQSCQGFKQKGPSNFVRIRFRKMSDFVNKSDFARLYFSLSEIYEIGFL